MNDIRLGDLKDVFNALELAFKITGTDFYVIGAMAKDVWFSRKNLVTRQTKDVDVAVMVGNQQDYEAVKEYLKSHHSFKDTRANAFSLTSATGIVVDILPFGGISVDDDVAIIGHGLTTISVSGFQEIFSHGTENAKLETGHSFAIASLSAIVLLKIIAYSDRPEERSKDARDIANIIQHYFDLEEEIIYAEENLDLWDTSNERSLEEIGAIVLGREIKNLLSTNLALQKKIKNILATHIQQFDESRFIRNMVAENGKDVETSVKWIMHLMTGIG